MYTQFKQTDNNSYQLKEQAIVSTILIVAVLLAVTVFSLINYLKHTEEKNLLWSAIIFGAITAIALVRQFGTKFIVDPAKKVFIVHSLGKKTEYRFEDYRGPIYIKVKGAYGIPQGTGLQLEFDQNGKEKKLTIAGNVSQKKVRIITEEINQLMKA